jgi:hypothetical protein
MTAKVQASGAKRNAAASTKVTSHKASGKKTDGKKGATAKKVSAKKTAPKQAKPSKKVTAKPTASAKKTAAKPKATKPTKKVGKPSAAKASGTASLKVPDVCPFRESSAYGKVWTVLYNNREKGITRTRLVEEAVKVTGKPPKNAMYDIAVVTSPDKDGKAHRSANKAANHYYVEKSEGGRLKLVMRKQ